MSRVFRRVTVILALLCLLAGVTVPCLPVEPQGGVALAETTIFTYSGTGSATTPSFTVSTSPWKLQYRTDYSANLGVQVGGSTVVNSYVVADVLYETFVYGETGNLHFTVTPQVSGGGWTLWVPDTFPPNFPGLLAPGDGVILSSISPSLDWADASDHSAVSYSLELDDNVDFSSPVVSKTGLTASGYTLGGGESLAEGTYHWRVKAVDVNGNETAWTAAWAFSIGPTQPSNSSPTDDATGTSLTPTLESSAFLDPTVGHTHAASQWQITTTAGGYSSPLFDSGTDTSNLTSIAVPSGTLANSTTYYWHVRHQDNLGNWSAWSAETSFTTTAPPNQPPNQPVNTSPASGTTLHTLTVTLRSSGFSDPNTGDTHLASHWQVRTGSGTYSGPNYDSSTDNANLVAISLQFYTYDTYYWHVRYQDDHGAWSDWSNETLFTLSEGTSPDGDQTPLDKSGDGVPWWVWVVGGLGVASIGGIGLAYYTRKKNGKPQPQPSTQPPPESPRDDSDDIRPPIPDDSVKDRAYVSLGVDRNADCYQVLGVTRAATKEEIDTAFKQKQQGWHPDKFPSESDKKMANAVSKILNNARDQIYGQRGWK